MYLRFEALEQHGRRAQADERPDRDRRPGGSRERPDIARRESPMLPPAGSTRGVSWRSALVQPDHRQQASFVSSPFSSGKLTSGSSCSGVNSSRLSARAMSGYFCAMCRTSVCPSGRRDRFPASRFLIARMTSFGGIGSRTGTIGSMARPTFRYLSVLGSPWKKKRQSTTCVSGRPFFSSKPPLPRHAEKVFEPDQGFPS